MQFGMAPAAALTRWDDVVACALVAEAGRWECLWIADHFIPALPGQDSTRDCFEGFSLLAALAAVTERIRLGSFVAGNTYRNPALLAKMAATLDHISRGRFTLGIGAGHVRREHEAYFGGRPSMRERSDRLEEACALIAKLLVADEPVDLAGRYYPLDSAPFAPKCIQRPRVPIMVGGGGERRTLRTLAHYGDIMNVTGPPPVVQHKLDVLARHCEAIGRDPGEIQKTVHHPVMLLRDEARAQQFRERLGAGWGAGAGFDLSRPEDQKRYLAIGSADHILEVFRRYDALGIDQIIFLNTPNRPALYRELDEEVLAPYLREG